MTSAGSACGRSSTFHMSRRLRECAGAGTPHAELDVQSIGSALAHCLHIVQHAYLHCNPFLLHCNPCNHKACARSTTTINNHCKTTQEKWWYTR